MRSKLYIKFFKYTEFGANFIVKDLSDNDLGLFKWHSKDYNSKLWHLNNYTKVSVTIEGEDGKTLKNIRVLNS